MTETTDWRHAAEEQADALARSSAASGESVGTAIAAQNLAVTYKYLGRFDEAEGLYRQALNIAEDAGDRALVASVCHNLGGLFHARGDHATGIPWARRAVEVRATLDDPLGLAADQGALAGMLLDAGEVDEAAALLTHARATFVALLGPDDYEVGVVDGNLAVCALERGDLDEAERRARSALQLKTAALGPAHPGLAVTLTALGTIRRRQGAADEAAQLHRLALELLRPAVEPEHPLLRTIEDNLDRASALG